MQSTVHPSSAAIRGHADDALPWKPGSLERIMIIAPHPDDEVLAAGGVIATAVILHSALRVIVVTNGDASYATALSHGSHLLTKNNFRRQAILRQQESLQALASLGLDANQVHFWGFPDRGLASLWKSELNDGSSYRSNTTGYLSSIQALNSPVMPFRAASLDELIRNEFVEFHPTTVIMPHPNDNHSDHSAMAGFTLRAVRHLILHANIPPPRMLAYWMWQQADKPLWTGPAPGDLAQFHLEADSATPTVQHLILNPEIKAQKIRALRCYPSQKIPAGKIFREASRRTRESFTLIHPT